MWKLFWFHNQISLVENQQKAESKEVLVYTSLRCLESLPCVMQTFKETFSQQFPKPLRLLLWLVTADTHTFMPLYWANFLHIQTMCLLETFSFSVLLLTIWYFGLWRKSITFQFRFILIISKYFFPLSLFSFFLNMDKRRNLWFFCIFLAFSVCWLALKLRTLPFMHLYGLYLLLLPHEPAWFLVVTAFFDSDCGFSGHPEKCS